MWKRTGTGFEAQRANGEIYVIRPVLGRRQVDLSYTTRRDGTFGLGHFSTFKKAEAFAKAHLKRLEKRERERTAPAPSRASAPRSQFLSDETIDVLIDGQREKVRIVQGHDGTYAAGVTAVVETSYGVLENKRIVGTGPTREAALQAMLAKRAKQVWHGDPYETPEEYDRRTGGRHVAPPPASPRKSTHVPTPRTPKPLSDRTVSISVGGERVPVRVLQWSDRVFASGMKVRLPLSGGRKVEVVGHGATTEAAMHDMLAKYAVMTSRR
jgi:hypothetical protein